MENMGFHNYPWVQIPLRPTFYSLSIAFSNNPSVVNIIYIYNGDVFGAQLGYRMEQVDWLVSIWLFDKKIFRLNF